MTPATTYLLYLVFALGGAGLYLLLPKPGRSQGVAGAILGLLALAGLIVVLAARSAAEGTTAFFYLFAGVALVAASRVITHSRPVYSALYFVLVVLAVAALLILQAAEFLAVALVIIYAGAILVTYLFVIMLAQQPGSPVYDRRSREPFLSVLAGFILAAALAGQLGELPDTSGPSQESSKLAEAVGASDAAPPREGSRVPSGSVSLGNTSAIGASVMTRYVVVLEVSGILLLVSLVGALGMSRKRVTAEGAPPAGRALGQIGKEVPPY